MPARKSCWSRIIGERAVRPIASSTSASIEASVPWTISTRIGSGRTAHHHVAEVVDAGREAGVERQRRAELLDDGRAFDLAAEAVAAIDGRVDPTVEVHRPRPVASIT